MLRLQGWKPIDWPGDQAPAIGPRRRIDWVVLAVMLIDVALFAMYVAPWFRTRASSPAGFIVFLLMLAVVWLGPFLGLLVRRGRGAALLCYAVVKLSIAIGICGRWWGHRLAESQIAPAPWRPICWHLFGAVLSFVALSMRRRAVQPRPHVIGSTSPTAADPG